MLPAVLRQTDRREGVYYPAEVAKIFRLYHLLAFYRQLCQ